MNIILHSKEKTARKMYDCAASEWIVAGDPVWLAEKYNFTFAEKRMLVTMKQERYKIYPKDRYLEQVGIRDDEFFCVQCRLDAVFLCDKYDLCDF